MTERLATSTIGIVLPPVWTHVFLSSARLLQHAFEDLGLRATLLEYDGRLDHDLSVVLGWSLFNEPFPPGSRYVLYQLEPLCLPLWRERLAERRLLFEQAAAIWDYSPLNLSALSGLPSAHCVPLGYHPRLREITPSNEPAQHDVLFVGFASSRRRVLLESLGNRCLVSVQPRWGRELLAALASSKIVLNIHQFDEPTPVEQARVAYVLNQGLFVVSESSPDDPYPGLVTAPYPELVDRTLHYLYHPTERRNARERMVAAFSSTSMSETLRRALASLTL
jgi:hypothetical protein